MLVLSPKSSKRLTEEVSCALASGLQHHQAGRLPEAESRYREILNLNSDHPDALHLLGVIAQQTGRYAAAVQLIRSAINHNPRSADYHNNLGNTYRLQNQWTAAIDCYRAATLLDPQHLDALHSLANALAEQGEFTEAEASFRRVLQLQPDHAEALYNFGNAKAAQADFAAAIDCYRQAVLLKPDRAEFHFNLAHALQNNGSLSQAAQTYRRALAIAPEDSDAHYNLGIVLHLQSKLPEASEAFRRAVALKPNYPEALSNLAAVLQKLDDFSAADELLRRAIVMDPSLAVAHCNLGGNLWRQGDLAAALESCRRAVLLNPNLSEAYANLGHVLADQGDLPGALDHYNRALALKPDAAAHGKSGTKPRQPGDLPNAIASLRNTSPQPTSSPYCRDSLEKLDSAEILYYVALLHLLRGDFSTGWQNYEYRWDTRALHKSKRDFPQPLWVGQPLRATRILLHAEQGIGDTIQFARFVPLVAARQATVILEVQPELRSLCTGMEGALQVIVRGDKLPDFEWHCPLLSLPLAFHTELQTIPANVPYFRPNPSAVQTLSQHLQGEGLRVGLVWSGNPLHVRDPQRSIPLAQLRPLLEVNCTTFYSLQKGPAAKQIAAVSPAMKLSDLGPQLHDFADTAAVLSNLDLLISVDTAVAHLAGALGKPVWILLTHAPDWRWLLDRDDSPWYPTARLFRQPAAGDWSFVIEQVATELRELAFMPPQRDPFRSARELRA